MTEQGHVRYGNSDITYTVVRSTRRKKTIEVTLDSSEGVLVAAPTGASVDAIRDVVFKRANWILTRADEGVLAPKPKQFISGETLPYSGREVRMDVVHGDVPAVRLSFGHWAFVLTVPSSLDGEERREAIRKAFQRWYRRRAGEAVRRSVARWSAVMSLAPADVSIRDQRQRWASCGPDGRLRFNWRIVMADSQLLDYVVVHELAHLTIRNHSRDFWGIVEAVLPDFRQRRQRLREAGPRLSL